MAVRPLIEHFNAIVSEVNRLEGLGFPTLDPESEIEWLRTIAVSQGEYNTARSQFQHGITDAHLDDWAEL